jgi:Tfp pilus assembly protein PilF
VRFATSFAALAFLVIGVCLASPFNQALSWAGKATTHFALFTAQPNDNAQELLTRLEKARLFFEKSGWASQDLKQPLCILAFPSEKDFDAYRPTPGAFAFYQHTRQGDFVLMRSLDPAYYSVVVHEYTHYIVHHAGLRLPLWLNEGLADLYSTLESQQGQVLVGTPPPGREDILRHKAWLDWNTLTAVDSQSPYYRQPDKMLLFYSQSWAFVHLLALNTVYENRFHEFLSTISGNPTTEGSFTATYHKSLQDLGSETEQNVKGNGLVAHAINLDVRTGLLQSAEVADPGKQAEFLLADVLAANPNAFNDAKARLDGLAARYPDDPHAEESLGFLAFNANRKSEAEEHFARAVKAHSNNAEVLSLLAHFQIEHGASGDAVIDLLRRALAADGTNYNALLELGFAAAKSQQFDVAVQALEKIQPKPEHAFPVWYTMAYCLSELHLNNRALVSIEKAQKTANNPRDKQQASELLAYINDEAKEEVASK